MRSDMAITLQILPPIMADLTIGKTILPSEVMLCGKGDYKTQWAFVGGMMINEIILDRMHSRVMEEPEHMEISREHKKTIMEFYKGKANDDEDKAKTAYQADLDFLREQVTAKEKAMGFAKKRGE